MGDEDDLFLWRPPVRRADPQTSEDAAKGLDASRLHDVICVAFRTWNSGGMVIDEISRVTGLDRQTLSPRMVELECRSLVHRIEIGVSASGRVRYQSRKGLRGKQQQEWFLGPQPNKETSP